MWKFCWPRALLRNVKWDRMLTEGDFGTQLSGCGVLSQVGTSPRAPNIPRPCHCGANVSRACITAMSDSMIMSSTKESLCIVAVRSFLVAPSKDKERPRSWLYFQEIANPMSKYNRY